MSYFDSLKDAYSDIPNFDYAGCIRSPSEYNMGKSGSKISKNIDGVIGWINLLLFQSGSKEDAGVSEDCQNPLGPKTFLKTGTTCKDSDSGEDVDRYIYLSMTPTGTIPLLTDSDLSGTGLGGVFKGLVPGILDNFISLVPDNIFDSMSQDEDSPCREVTLETINNDGESDYETHHILDSDIKVMSPCWFTHLRDITLPDNLRKNPITNERCETESAADDENFQNYKTQPLSYSKMPEGKMGKLYYSMLTLLLFYILVKLYKRK